MNQKLEGSNVKPSKNRFSFLVFASKISFLSINQVRLYIRVFSNPFKKGYSLEDGLDEIAATFN